MVRSPRSRGKGNRRFPGRPGGARKLKQVGNWEHRAQHRVADPARLAQPVVSLWYNGEWGRELEHRAYVFDQEMANLGVPYFAEVGIQYRRRVLRVTVPESQAAQVAEVIARLERR